MGTAARRVWRVGVACLILMVCGAWVPAAELRQWSDATGKFKITAKFVSLEGSTVTLEQQDGSEIEIDLKKLSTADQKFIADMSKAEADSPFKSKTKSDDPFKAKSSSKGKPASTESGTEETKAIKVDWSPAETINLTPPEDGWKVEPPKPTDASSSFKPKSAMLPQKTSFFEGMKGVAISLDAKKAVVGYVVADPRPTGVTRLVMCDLATGKAGASASSPGQMMPLALHPDGQQILMRRDEFGFGNLDRLEVWTLSGSKVQKRLIWNPYESDQGAARDVMWAEFVDGDRLATSSRNGKVAIWKYPEIEPICTFQLADGAVPSLSPDRKLIAYSTGTDVGVFDIDKQQVIAQRPTPAKLQWPYMSFSPSGKRLACIAFDKVLTWDTATGELERNILCSGLNVHGSIEFPDDDFVLGGGKFLIDLPNQLKFWQYDGAEQVRCVAGWTLFGLSEGHMKPGALIATQIPQPAAKDLLKKALSDPNLFVLKAGTTVKLDLSGIPDAAQKPAVERGLTQRLQEIGCQPGPNGTIDLVASVEGPKEREVSYFGSGDYKVKEYISKARFVYQGKPAWESSATNVPFVISLKRGENIEGHLREREKPDYAFFERVEFPKFLQKPADGQGPGRSLTLGTSRVTPTGFK